MVSLGALWWPILLSAVLVFVVSSLMHMILPWHKGDFAQIADGSEVLAAMRKAGMRPGQYMFPACSDIKEMGSPEMKAKYEAGPVGHMTILPNGTPSIGRSLVQWFVYSLLIGVFAAYVGTLCLARGAGYEQAFRVTGTVAILGYAVPNLTDSIWKGQRWGVTFRFVVDGLVYGLVTAGTFGWLWP